MSIFLFLQDLSNIKSFCPPWIFIQLLTPSQLTLQRDSRSPWGRSNLPNLSHSDTQGKVPRQLSNFAGLETTISLLFPAV